MNIDWWALVLVALVSIGMSVVFVILLATGIRLVVTSHTATRSGGRGAVALSTGYTLLGLAGLLVLFGIYLIVPQFH